MSITLEHGIPDQIKTHLEAAYPDEACGFLLGSEEKQQRHITHIFPVENRSTENLRRRFVIDPLDYLKAEKTAVVEDLVLLGIYHSHPDHPAIPSAHDLEYAQPFFSYFIHAVHNGVLTDTRSYRLSEEGDFAVEEILLTAVIEQ